MTTCKNLVNLLKKIKVLVAHLCILLYNIVMGQVLLKRPDNPEYFGQRS